MPSESLLSCMGVVAPRNPRQSLQVVQHFQATPESIDASNCWKRLSILVASSKGIVYFFHYCQKPLVAQGCLVKLFPACMGANAVHLCVGGVPSQN